MRFKNVLTCECVNALVKIHKVPLWCAVGLADNYYRTIEVPTTSDNHRSKQYVSPVRQNFMNIPLFLKIFSMA